MLRCCLAALAVILCYRFEWAPLRWLMSEAMLLELRLFGVPAWRIASDKIQWGQAVFRYDIGCTFADVLCGSLPFLWSLRRSIPSNVACIASYAICLFALNIVRLAGADWIYWSSGLVWEYVDEPIGGICYFVVWLWLFRRATLERL